MDSKATLWQEIKKAPQRFGEEEEGPGICLASSVWPTAQGGALSGPWTDLPSLAALTKGGLAFS